jgi:hypothetical protein
MSLPQEYDVLPDPATWATGYSLFKFVEPPASESAVGDAVIPSSTLFCFSMELDSDPLLFGLS